MFVVDLPVLPKLPIHDGGASELKPYAEALTTAIETGIVKEPGKYAIDFITATDWKIYTVNE
jgi:hypothetical protein